jgi:hypothetical protein
VDNHEFQACFQVVRQTTDGREYVVWPARERRVRAIKARQREWNGPDLASNAPGRPGSRERLAFYEKFYREHAGEKVSPFSEPPEATRDDSHLVPSHAWKYHERPLQALAQLIAQQERRTSEE